MAKTGKYIHRGEWVGDVGLTTAYAASGNGLPVKVNQSEAYGGGLTGRLSHLLLRFDNFNNNPTKATAFITTDAAGANVLVPESEMTLTFGRGAGAAATAGCAARLDVDVRVLRTELGGGVDVFAWVKTDTGTMDVRQINLFWEE